METEIVRPGRPVEDGLSLRRLGTYPGFVPSVLPLHVWADSEEDAREVEREMRRKPKRPRLRKGPAWDAFVSRAVGRLREKEGASPLEVSVRLAPGTRHSVGEVLDLAGEGDDWCQVRVTRGGVTFRFPCARPRHTKCVLRAILNDASERLAWLGGRDAAFLKFPDRAAAVAYRDRHGLREQYQEAPRTRAEEMTGHRLGGEGDPVLDGNGDPIPVGWGGRTSWTVPVGQGSEVVVVVPAEHAPAGSPVERGPERVGAALFRLAIAQWVTVPEPKDGTPSSVDPQFRSDASDELIEEVARDAGIAFDYRSNGRLWSMFHFYASTPEEVDGLVLAVNARVRDRARASPV
jgi:hypothetical protein